MYKLYCKIGNQFVFAQRLCTADSMQRDPYRCDVLRAYFKTIFSDTRKDSPPTTVLLIVALDFYTRLCRSISSLTTIENRCLLTVGRYIEHSVTQSSRVSYDTQHQCCILDSKYRYKQFVKQ